MSDTRDHELTFGSIRVDRLTYIDFVAKYWGDPEFRKRVDQDPAAVLRKEGFDVPDGTAVTLLQSDSDRLHVVLPDASNPKPSRTCTTEI